MPSINYPENDTLLFNKIKLSKLNQTYRLTRQRILAEAIIKYHEDNKFKNSVDECIKINNDKMIQGKKIVMQVNDDLKKAIKQIALENDAKEYVVVHCLLSHQIKY